jgi:hypothetical protein
VLLGLQASAFKPLYLQEHYAFVRLATGGFLEK